MEAVESHRERFLRKLGGLEMTGILAHEKPKATSGAGGVSQNLAASTSATAAGSLLPAAGGMVFLPKNVTRPRGGVAAVWWKE